MTTMNMALRKWKKLKPLTKSYFCWNSENLQIDLAIYVAKIIVLSYRLLRFVASCRLWKVVAFRTIASIYLQNVPKVQASQ